MEDAIDIAMRFGFIPSTNNIFYPLYPVTTDANSMAEWEHATLQVNRLDEEWYRDNLYWAKRYLCDLICPDVNENIK